MKILLTGASGFIGGHLLHALIKKFGKDAVIALTSNEIHDTEYFIYGSINDFGLDKNCFDNITHVIHAGAFIPKDSQQANHLVSCFESIEYTQHLFSYSFKNITKLINISTVDIYATTDSSISEKSKIDPVSLYGSSKLYCEKMVKAFSEQREVSYMNLRIGHVYGPGEEKYKKVIPIAMQNIIEGKPLDIWGKGDDLRSFIFIEDVVESIINSIDSSLKDVDINIASGNAVSIHELLDKIIDVSGEQVKINKIESNHIKRDLVFDNSLLLKTLLNNETDIQYGLKKEYTYMKAKHENSI